MRRDCYLQLDAKPSSLLSCFLNPCLALIRLSLMDDQSQCKIQTAGSCCLRVHRHSLQLPAALLQCHPQSRVYCDVPWKLHLSIWSCALIRKKLIKWYWRNNNSCKQVLLTNMMKTKEIKTQCCLTCSCRAVGLLSMPDLHSCTKTGPEQH